jgi:CubicO group peptidase (beta-lactamase class C family)
LNSCGTFFLTLRNTKDAYVWMPQEDRMRHLPVSTNEAVRPWYSSNIEPAKLCEGYLSMTKNRLRTISSLTLLVISSLPCFATTSAAQQSLDKYFEALATNRDFNGNVLVAENGRILFNKSFGYSNFEEHSPNTPDTPFPIASVSKLLTGTAILQLAQHSRLRVDDPVTKYLPTFPYPELTVRHLLSHTSGLPAYNAYFDPLHQADPARVFTDADFLPVVASKKLPLVNLPGAKREYNNINFIVLALIIEKASGQTYESYIETHILKPAGMRQTKFMQLPFQYTKLPPSAHFAFPYLYLPLYSEVPIRANTVPLILGYWHSYAFKGFGDYVSTTHDLLLFDKALYSGLILNKAMQEFAFAPAFAQVDRPGDDPFGLAWQIRADASLGKVVYHGGEATGLSCILLRNISRHQTVILFDNTHSNAHQVADATLRILNGTPVPQPKKSVTKLYAQTLLKEDPSAARLTLDSLLADTANYAVDEDEMNDMGYALMESSNIYELPEAPHPQAALEVFKTNTQLFPQSWNAWDSYGEVLRKQGHTQESITAYERSLVLNGGNEGAKKALAEMR